MTWAGQGDNIGQDCAAAVDCRVQRGTPEFVACLCNQYNVAPSCAGPLNYVEPANDGNNYRGALGPFTPACPGNGEMSGAAVERFCAEGNSGIKIAFGHAKIRPGGSDTGCGECYYCIQPKGQDGSYIVANTLKVMGVDTQTGSPEIGYDQMREFAQGTGLIGGWDRVDFRWRPIDCSEYC
jgi:hypothetical protein